LALGEVGAAVRGGEVSLSGWMDGWKDGVLWSGERELCNDVVLYEFKFCKKELS